MRLKEHDQPVLVLEKSPRASTLGSIKYVCVFVCEEQFKLSTKSDVEHTFMQLFESSCLFQVHCDIRNTREDSRTLLGDHEDGHTSQ